MKRVADPYRDLDVIDARAPRFNQATVGLLAVVAVATGWWWLLAVLGAQLVVGLTLAALDLVATHPLAQRLGAKPEPTRDCSHRLVAFPETAGPPPHGTPATTSTDDPRC